jgi:hypothetical protein
MLGNAKEQVADLLPLVGLTWHNPSSLVLSLTTLALDVADPLVTGHYGKAAFDAVGPLLLIGWAEVGPVLLQAIASIRRQPSVVTDSPPADGGAVAAAKDVVLATRRPRNTEARAGDEAGRLVRVAAGGELVDHRLDPLHDEPAHHRATPCR